MAKTQKCKNSDSKNLLRRIRESAGLTMRQAGGLIGISHVAISQFENGKLELPDYRIKQMIHAYGLSEGEYARIKGSTDTIDVRVECRRLIDSLQTMQVAALYEFLKALALPVGPQASEEEASNERHTS